MLHRRRFLATASVSLAGGMAVVASATSTGSSTKSNDPDSGSPTKIDGSGWAMYGGGPGHARAATWTTGPDSRPSTAWSYSPEWDQNETTTAEPAIVDDTVYVGLTGRDRYGSGVNGKIVALDAADGTERWKYEHECGGFRTPAVVDGIAYVGGTRGRVYALDATNGELHWTQTVGSDDTTSQLTVADNTVYVTGDHTYALDAKTGDIRWTTEALVRPSFWREQLFGYDIRDHEFTLVALEATTGDELWATTLPVTPAGELLKAPPPVRGGVVLGASGGAPDEAYAFDAADGTQRWNDAGDGVVLPALDRERVYGTFTYGPPVHAHDAETGDEVWSTEKAFASDLAVAGDSLYLSLTGEIIGKPALVALNVDNGAERWRLCDHRGKIAIADGTIYLAGAGVTALR